MPPLTPGQIQSSELRLALRGYDRDETDRLLRKIATNYEELWKERKALRERLQELEAALGDMRRREQSVGEALVIAENTGKDLVDEARREAERILQDAREQAEKTIEDAAHDRGEAERVANRLRDVAHRTRTDLSVFLSEALERLRTEGLEQRTGAGDPEAERSLIEDLDTDRTSARE